MTRRLPFHEEPEELERLLKEALILKAEVDLHKEIWMTGKRLYGRELTDAEILAACQIIEKLEHLTVEEAIKLALAQMPGGAGN